MRTTPSRPRAAVLAVTAGMALALSLPGTALSAEPADPPLDAASAAAVQEALELSRQDSRSSPESTPGTTSVVVGTSLERGQTLAPGDALQSPSGQYRLVMDEEGALILVKAPNRLNSQPYVVAYLALGIPGSRLVLQTDDGNLVLYGPDGSVQQNFGINPARGAESLRVQDDGNVVVYDDRGRVALNLDTVDPEGLDNGGTLLPEERLTSASGSTSLVMQGDGNLVLYVGGAPVFASGTFVPGSAAVLQADGNVVVYSPTGRPVYFTGTRTDGNGEILAVTDGEFRVLTFAGDVSVISLFGSAWGSDVVVPGAELLMGDRRTAANGSVLILQEDGNLVQYVNGRPRFQSRTSGAAFAVMQPDGNFVVYAFSGPDEAATARFSTRTGGNPGSRLVVQRDDNIVIYTPAGRPVFWTLR